MNHAEKRRRILLEQTRKKYNDDFLPPAVHPRYRNTYYELYDYSGAERKNTFFTRTMISILLFVFLVFAEQNKVPIYNMSSSEVQEIIKNDTDISSLLSEIISVFEL